jgi:hypothetical protein
MRKIFADRFLKKRYEKKIVLQAAEELDEADAGIKKVISPHTQ